MQTLLQIKNEDTYGDREAREIVTALYDEFSRDQAAFHGINLDKISVELKDGVRLSIQNSCCGKSGEGIERLVCLADALHTTGDLRIILDRADHKVAMDKLESYIKYDTNQRVISEQCRHQMQEAEVLLGNYSQRTKEYCYASLKRIRDFYALSSLLPQNHRPLMDLTMAVLLEASHRIDDYYDNDVKWCVYGYLDVEEAITDVLTVTAEILKGKSFSGEVLVKAENLLAYVKAWVGGDSNASSLNLSDAAQRIIECNGDLYKRFYDICTSAIDVNGQYEDLFKDFGALVWVLDDWRDVEMDALNDHFNVFTPFRMDVREQVNLVEGYLCSMLRKYSKLLDHAQLEEILTSAGVTNVMKEYLKLYA